MGKRVGLVGRGSGEGFWGDIGQILLVLSVCSNSTVFHVCYAQIEIARCTICLMDTHAGPVQSLC